MRRHPPNLGTFVETEEKEPLGGRGVGDYTALNRLHLVLIMGIKTPYPPQRPYD